MHGLIISLLLPLCAATLSFGPAYSAGPADKSSLMEKVRKADKAMDTLRQPLKGCNSPQ